MESLVYHSDDILLCCDIVRNGYGYFGRRNVDWCLWRPCLRLGFEGLDASAVVGNCLLQVVNLLSLFLDVII